MHTVLPSPCSAHSRAPCAGATNGQVTQAAPARSAASRLARSLSTSVVSGRSQSRCVRRRPKVRAWESGERTRPRNRIPGAWPSSPPSAGTRRRTDMASHRRRWCGGGPAATAASGSRSQCAASAGVRHPSAASVVSDHSSMPSQPSGSSSAGQPWGRTIRRASAGISMRPPTENGCAANPMPPAARTAPGDLDRRTPRVGDLAFDPEGQVVPPLGADLGAHHQEDALVHALPAVAAGTERVVVGDQERVGARRASGVQHFGDRRRAVGVCGVHMHHARDVEQRGLGHARMVASPVGECRPAASSA